MEIRKSFEPWRVLSMAFRASFGWIYPLDKRAPLWYDVPKRQRGVPKMAVRLNEDKEMVQTIREGLKRTGGYCPCRLERTEENKCMCKEFRDQIADPDFKGYCHCMLYYKD